MKKTKNETEGQPQVGSDALLALLRKAGAHGTRALHVIEHAGLMVDGVIDICALTQSLKDKSYLRRRNAGMGSYELLVAALNVTGVLRAKCPTCGHLIRVKRANSDYPEQLSR